MALHRRTKTHIHTPQYTAYLWRNVVRGATEGARAHSVDHVLFTHAKVGDLYVSLRVQHHIVQLQIPKEAHGYLKQHRGGWLLLKWPYGYKTAETLPGGHTQSREKWVKKVEAPVDDSSLVQEKEANSDLCCIEPAMTPTDCDLQKPRSPEVGSHYWIKQLCSSRQLLWELVFVRVLHSLGFLKLANLLDMIHQVSTVHILHDKVEAVLPSQRQGKPERIQTLQGVTQKPKELDRSASTPPRPSATETWRHSGLP